MKTTTHPTGSRLSRREFIQTTGAAITVTLAAPQVLAQQPNMKPLPTVRVGFVGIGVKGSAHLGNLLRMPGVEVRAVCDIVEAQCVEAQKQAERLGHKTPRAYFRGERDFERLCAEEELDLVYTATPWHWHVPVCLAAMKHGKHAATEVPAAYTLEECWALVETAEKTGCHCVQMENVNYQRNELVTLRMIRERVLGEIVHCEGAYLHDTRHLKIHDYGDGLWLGDHHATRNGCLYPTHGIGPLAWYTNQNRGDRLDHMVSMSSNARVGPHLVQRSKVLHNDIADTGRLLLDSGQSAIYFNNHNAPTDERRLDGVIAWNRIGTVHGLRDNGKGMGIYLDDGTDYVDIHDNFIDAGPKIRWPIFLHAGGHAFENTRVTGNLVRGIPNDLRAAAVVMGPRPKVGRLSGIHISGNVSSRGIVKMLHGPEEGFTLEGNEGNATPEKMNDHLRLWEKSRVQPKMPGQ